MFFMILNLIIYSSDEARVSTSVDIDIDCLLSKYHAIEKHTSSKCKKDLNLINTKSVLMGTKDLKDLAESMIASSLFKLQRSKPNEYLKLIAKDSITCHKHLFMINRDIDDAPLLPIEFIECPVDVITESSQAPDWNSVFEDLIKYYRTGEHPDFVYYDDIRVSILNDNDFMVRVLFEDYESHLISSEFACPGGESLNKITSRKVISALDVKEFEDNPNMIVRAAVDVALEKNTVRDAKSILLGYAALKRHEFNVSDNDCFTLVLSQLEEGCTSLSIEL